MKALKANISPKQISKLYIAISGIFYGSLGLLGLSLRYAKMPLESVLFWRFGVAGILLFFYVWLQKIDWKKDLKECYKSFFLAAFLYCSAAAFLFLACEYIGTGLGMVLFFTYPIFVTCFAWIFENKKLDFLSAFCLSLVCLGITLLSKKTGSAQGFNMPGVLSGLMGAIFYALYLFSSKKQMKKANPINAALFMCLGSALLALLVCGCRGTFVCPMDTTMLRDVFLISFICTTLPVFWMLKGLQNVDAATASILSVLRPVSTILLGYIFLNEQLSGAQVLGISIIILATVAIQIKADH